jgi:hypothetical protein
LFAINQIHFVPLRIHAAGRRTAARSWAACWFLASQVILIALFAVVCGLQVFPWYSALAFVPVLWRGFAWFTAEPRPLAVHTLGKSELGYACLFEVLLVLAMAFR